MDVLRIPQAQQTHMVGLTRYLDLVLFLSLAIFFGQTHGPSVNQGGVEFVFFCPRASNQRLLGSTRSSTNPTILA